MSTTSSTPFYQKFSLSLLGIVLIGALIFIGKSIALPIAFACVFAILLLPVHKWMVKKGMPEVISLLLSIFLALLFFSALIYFLSSQVASFANDLPQIKEKLNHHITTVKGWVSQQFGISAGKQEQAIAEAAEGMKSSGSGMAGNMFMTAAQGLLMIFLLPVYTFLIMYYRRLIRKFFIKVFRDGQRGKVEEVINESQVIIQSYMVGLLIELAIVAVLNAAGFFFLGIQYAIFLAVLAAVLNMIPYIGMLIAAIICMGVTLTTSDNVSDVVWVGVMLTAVQFIDNNLIMPKVVGSKVRINALASIVGVLVGGALGGVGGMFLSIPGVAIMKAVFERVPELEAWGLLLGDDNELGNKKPGRRKTSNK